MHTKDIQLSVAGMSCAHCELTIENALSDMEGVLACKSSFSKGKVFVTYNPEMVSIKEIKAAINGLDYQCVDEKITKTESFNSQTISILIILLGGYVILKHLGVFQVLNFFPQVQEGFSLGMLFLIGALTSLHCVAMCGGINLAQSINSAKTSHSALMPNILYNLGRVVSYTIIGGIVGGVGSIISIGGGFRGAVAVFAGVFMIVMGLNMLNLFPWLRRFAIRMPKFIGKKLGKNAAALKKKKGAGSSFYIGLLNGLMPCGPLQSMQLYALSAGSVFMGALSMFLFSLGTVPLMFLLGAVSTKLNKNFTEKMMFVCALLVVVLGVGMLNNGLALSGVTLPQMQATQGGMNQAVIDGKYQHVTTNIDYGTYPPITVKAGVPVQWTIVAEKGMINGCNNEIIIPEFGITVKLVEGNNVIEFLPDKAGTFGYSCWMGMIRSFIAVTE
ncbi:hypothetical protein acsn021_31460 [Anaerocolumna cellulosilytica]|uniref:Uncharacterized protein n=1 Tax=Anaerocolumna cellulosilytica TaxID=433286 RepID=A0A6S6R662_9FIRM|nr:sulfite exporter TauE/SafE family protein [Anaerocolumna cellulosilytica]MBB5198080.1 sulfite exporter TauE/SafE/copper chaperone CopZ [Anaerocolumna cellulosilytica]BCJ95577.1 hypothetical protein acsn021_31460 [Anaerocolumna cellulosilytica]